MVSGAPVDDASEPLVADSYDCVINYLDEFSKEKGIVDLTQKQSELREIVDAWKACAKLDTVPRFW